MAEAYNAQITLWMYCEPVNYATNIHLYITSPSFLAQEVIDTMSGLHAKIIAEPLKIKKGYIILSTKPGLGIGYVNETTLGKYPYNSSRR